MCVKWPPIKKFLCMVILHIWNAYIQTVHVYIFSLYFFLRAVYACRANRWWRGVHRRIARYRESILIASSKGARYVSEQTHWWLRVLTREWHPPPILPSLRPVIRICRKYEQRRHTAIAWVAFSASRGDFPLRSCWGETAETRTSLHPLFLIYSGRVKGKQHARQRCLACCLPFLFFSPNAFVGGAKSLWRRVG